MVQGTEAEARARHDTSIARLKAIDLRRVGIGYHHDGGGLYLQVREGTSGLTRSWVLRYTRHGKARIMGLGPLNVLGLADARGRAIEARKLLLDGLDPIETRDAHRAAHRVAVATTMTFGQAAAAYIASHEAGWRNLKHAEQWRATLATYAHPVLGNLPVASVDTGLVMKVLEPIWTAKPETANRVRGRIESILDYAAARGYRQGENPARWRGHLDNLLAAPNKTKRALRLARGKGEHFDALPYAKIAGFMSSLREQAGSAARALEFTILTAARTGEVIGARWAEINAAERVWIVPAERMKAGKEHRVPLSEHAIAILGEVGEPDAFVFPSSKPGQHMSNMSMLKLLQRMKLRTENGGLTVHGFRSTFMDWATEQTNFPAKMRDLALSHTVSDKVEAAYRRGDMFDRRRELMEAWAQACEPGSAGEKVVNLRVRG
jgi:integrase